MNGIITLTTDFGLKDPYVGAMKGAILSINPLARIVDVTHLIAPGDVLGGALVLAEACRYFPEGTIHVAVVDPGVGTKRRPILVESSGHIFVGPDNGLLGLAASGVFRIGGPGRPGRPAKPRAAHLKERKFFNATVSDTFHGRDVFGPAAAHLSLGVAPGDLGPAVDDAVVIGIPAARRSGGSVNGVVIRVDSFGNLITNIRHEDVARASGAEVRISGAVIKGIRKTYGSVACGRALALIGSAGLLEIAVNGGSAAALFKASAGARVTVKVMKR